MNFKDICGIEEIRLRVNKPLMIFKDGYDYFVSDSGLSKSQFKAYIVDKNDIERTLQLMSDFSMYAVEEEIKQGFLTLKEDTGLEL